MTILIVTDEKSGVDKYSQEIAKRLDVKKIKSRRYLSLIEAYRLSRVVRGERDVIHLPNQNFARYALFLKNPFIVTVHDLVRLCFGFAKETIIMRILLKLDIRGIKQASHIIAVSQSAKDDLIKYLKIPDDKISVIYNGVDHNIFRPYNIKLRDKPYILYVGSERPRKNLGRLFEAFAKIKDEFPELQLVKIGIAGRSPKYRRDTMKKLASLGITGRVTFVGYAPVLDLAHYYSSGLLLAYPSLYEGFGLPPLEAMACGCPVVTSNTSSLPEVVGEAGIMVDPRDTDSLVNAIRRVLTDDELRNNMIRKGLERAKEFSWGKAAEETQRVYMEVEKEVRQDGEQQMGKGENKAGTPREKA